MDSSLWLLTRLGLGGIIRRWRRSLARPKGILLTVAVALLFVPAFGASTVMLFVERPPVTTVGQVERFGPIGLFLFTLASLAATSGGAGLYFGPAEIDFLFPGPYRRRQLIAYKLIVACLGIGLTSLYFGTMGASATAHFGAAMIGSFLSLLFIHLLQTVVGLVFNLVGAVVWRRATRWLLAAVAVAALVAIAPSRDRVVVHDWPALGRAAEASPVTRAILAPFGWFVRTAIAPDLASLMTYGGLALVIDLGMIGAVFALDAGFLEAAATSSARRLLAAQRMVRGGGAIVVSRSFGGRFQLRLPDPPWLGGAGPNLWRQMTGAVANPQMILTLVTLAGGGTYTFATLMPHNDETRDILLPIVLGVGMPLTILLSLMLAYDFRGDLDVMETLKMLPIAPSRLALGQVLTPTLLASIIQGAGCLGAVVGTGGLHGQATTVGGILAFLLPANLFFYAVENILFLWFPSRVEVGQFNGAAAVRQLLLLMAKGFAVGVAAGLVAGVGSVAYLLAGRQVIPALVLAWGTLAGLAGAVLPLLGRAFAQFDVGADTPA